MKISSNELKIFNWIEDIIFKWIEDIFKSFEDIFKLFEDIFKLFEDIFKLFEDIFKYNISIIHLKQNRSTQGFSKLKSPETRQVQERLVSTLEHMQVPKWDRTRCPEE